MGQKVNPISNRLGIIRGWDSNWYGGNDYGDSLLEDSKIRKYLNARLAKASVSRIVIERTLKLVTITVCTARPGIIIGKGGQEVDKLKEELKKVSDKFNDWSKYKSHEYCDHSKLAAKNQCDYYDKDVEAHAHKAKWNRRSFLFQCVPDDIRNSIIRRSSKINIHIECSRENKADQ